MIPELRRSFNQAFTPEKYRALLDAMDAQAGCHVKYRQCETPCFFPESLLNKMANAGNELVTQLLSNQQYMADSKATIPAQFDVPREAQHPLFIQADFGLTSTLEPRLVEIQGFPS